MRPSVPGLCYAGLALHALFFVPQVRDALVHWVPETASLDDSVRSPEGAQPAAPPPMRALLTSA